MLGRRPPALALMIAWLAVPALAAVEQVRVRVEGLACPFCVFGIEKNLKKVPGVESLETTIRTGVVAMEMAAEATLEPDRIREAVARSGFSLRGIEATVTGRLTEHQERPALRVAASEQVLLLVEHGDGEVFGDLSPETHRRLRVASDDGKRLLTISGPVHDHADSPPALAVESFRAAE